MNLRDIATSLAQDESKSFRFNHQKTLLFVGSNSSGKTTLINHFLDKVEPVKKTLFVEYIYARKTNSGIHSLVKDVCDVWELGDVSLLSSLLSSFAFLTVVLVLDLSELDHLWLSLDNVLDTLKKQLSHQSSTKQNDLSDHTDYSIMDPFPVPLLIIGAKYDIFQKFEPEKKKIVCRSLRLVSHLLGATLVFYSTKDASLVKRVKELLNHHSFSTPQPKTSCLDYNKALYVLHGSDLVESIEGVGTSNKFTLDRARHVFTTHFPQDTSKLQSTKLDDPSKDPNFREPLVDSVRRQKDEELERYCQEMERREKIISVSIQKSQRNIKP